MDSATWREAIAAGTIMRRRKYWVPQHSERAPIITRIRSELFDRSGGRSCLDEHIFDLPGTVATLKPNCESDSHSGQPGRRNSRRVKRDHRYGPESVDEAD